MPCAFSAYLTPSVKQLSRAKGNPQFERLLVLQTIAVSGLSLENIFDAKIKTTGDKFITIKFHGSRDNKTLYVRSIKILGSEKVKLWKFNEKEVADEIGNVNQQE